MAAVAPVSPPQKSTIVRTPAAPRLLRTAFAVGSWVMPEATVRRASRLFGTPMASSRSRALAAEAAGQSSHPDPVETSTASTAAAIATQTQNP